MTTESKVAVTFQAEYPKQPNTGRKYTIRVYNYLSWSIIALLGWNLITVYRSLTIQILVLATLKINRIDTRPVLNNLILIPAILVREINTLVIILRRHLKATKNKKSVWHKKNG